MLYQTEKVANPISVQSDPMLDNGWLIDDPEGMLSWSREEDIEVAAKDLLKQYIYIELAANDFVLDEYATGKFALPEGILENLEEKNRLLAHLKAPIDLRIENYLEKHFADCNLATPLRLPTKTFVLDRHGIARQLALPDSGDEFKNAQLTSYRLANGVLHNPAADRRTTAGTFHVAEGGLPIPADKVVVPKSVFAGLFQAAVNPPDDSMTLPFTSNFGTPGKMFVSLLVRPLVCPAVKGYCEKKTMEIRFFVPGSLVSNLDFVESIFGNAGDPLVPKNDAALDVAHWTGHTGCVILAPHLTQVLKKDLGLPQWDSATESQRKSGMAWTRPDEKYNDGRAFKITCRTAEGVIVTLIADNYYGYCKKEVKTQISYSANLLGNVEEEHAGGTIAFASHHLGEEFQLDSKRYNGRTYAAVAKDYGDSFVELHPTGYGVDRIRPEIVYVNESARFSISDQLIRWTQNGVEESLALESNKHYIAPSGYRLKMEKHPWAPSWRLIGTSGEGTVCHKPCTVSGGGKSEISKSIRDYILAGPIFVSDIDKDFERIDAIFAKDYIDRWKADAKDKPDYSKRATRKVLDANRSLGSVIKLFTPSPEYTDLYNEWLREIPSHIYAMVFIIKRFAKPEWNGDWKSYFGVDIVNGSSGHELKFGNRKLVGLYLRVGLDLQSRWRTFKLRQDFSAADKIQLEDDITASVVVPGKAIGNVLPTKKSSDKSTIESSYKFVGNCEYRLFQRPDDAIHRGFDKQAELDMSRAGTFFCNYEPLDRSQVIAEKKAMTFFEAYTRPMKNRINSFVDEGESAYLVTNAHPRLVDGKPSKNPRYLQDRPDLTEPLDRYVALRAMQLARATPSDQPVLLPVNAILSGRRNNPPDQQAGFRSLAVYNPIHYQELPELFMDYICSLTGKSPSTTGAGSEGALTKSPFNALLPVHDLNAAVVSMMLTGLGGFSTAAGHIGSETEVGHDVSMLVPEIWCRLFPHEREPSALIESGQFERIADFEYEGRKIQASRLGYRMTDRFVQKFFGRIFDNPNKVFDEHIMKPETQSLAEFVDGVEHITEVQAKVASQYFVDNSIEKAIPPLRALIEIMAKGSYNGRDQHDPDFRKLFDREAMLQSDWYKARLAMKQKVDKALWQRHYSYLKDYCDRASHTSVIERLGLRERLDYAKKKLDACSSESYLESLMGTLGVDPTIYLGYA